MAKRDSPSDASLRPGWFRHRGNPAFLGAAAILLVVVVHQHLEIRSELLEPAPYFNDNVLHLSLARGAAAALERGDDPTDYWYSVIVEGYPLFHHYQHLPHAVIAGVHWLSGGALSVLTVFRWTTALMLFAFPFSVAWAVWRLGHGRTAAMFAGTAAALLSSDRIYGLDLTSYGWGGFGMTTQLWGSVLLGPAWAVGWRAVQEGRGRVLAAVLIAALLVTHTVLGYVAVLSLVLFLVPAGWRRLRVRVLRLAVVLALAGVGASYFVVPFFLDREAMNRSRWEKQEKYDSHGMAWTLGKLGGGDLLDDPTFTRSGSEPRFPGVPRRWPVLTVAAAIGFLFCLWRFGRRPAFLALPLLFGGWLLLYFGPATWGDAARHLPLGRDLHFHRLIAPVQLAGVALAGVGLGAIWDELMRRRGVAFALAAVVITAIPLGTAVLERHAYCRMRNLWRLNNRAAFAEEGGAIDRVLDRLETLPPGRAYAGRAGNWGHTYQIGAVQIYSLVTDRLRDNVGYLYHALSLNSDIEGYLDESRWAHYNLFNVRYVLAPAGRRFPDFVRFFGGDGRHRLYTVETTGYFDLVDGPVALAGSKRDWFDAVVHWLRSRLVEAKQHPVLFVDRPPAEGFPLVYSMALTEVRPYLDRLGALPAPPPAGTVREVEARPGRYAADVGASRRCFVLLKATYHPGWRATVDGRPAETVMLAPAFVGVPVGPGRHRVEVRYEAPRWRKVLLALGLLVLLGAGWFEWRGGFGRLEGRLAGSPTGGGAGGAPEEKSAET